jgi:hypothetical protein
MNFRILRKLVMSGNFPDKAHSGLDAVFDVLPIVFNDDPWCEIVKATWAGLVQINYFYREFTDNPRGLAPPVEFVKDDALPVLPALW